VVAVELQHAAWRYEVNISDQQLKGAPSYSNDNDWDWEDRKRAQQVYDYYRFRLLDVTASPQAGHATPVSDLRAGRFL